MRKILFLALTLCIASCSTNSSSDSSNTGTNPAADQNYFPLGATDYWVYEVNQAPSATVRRDSLYVNGPISFPNNANVYNKLSNKNTPWGFFSTCMNNNGLRKVNNRMLLTGTIAFDVLNTGTPISLDVTDFAFFSQETAAGTQMSTKSGTFTQTVSNIPLTINYTLTTTAMADESNFTVPGTTTTYPLVKKVNTTLQMQINASISTPIGALTASVLDSQKVVDSKQYYVANKGNVFTTTHIVYNMNQQTLSLLPSTTTLPFPTSNDITQTERLVKPF
ncbi:MAG: hypothetical protein CFE24_00290 [Flavobacterium sp. BFFFF2]|nr:MAG: hypothetical protein CFE24_00290 [Flavobacterium sp. BFFFF2]